MHKINTDESISDQQHNQRISKQNVSDISKDTT